MMKKTSLKDIAQVVGVSTALVSYVLNNQKEGRIGKEVARRIRAVAQELNYRPNQIARSLKTSKTFTLGLIVADIANPFSSALARYVEDAADRDQYTVILGSSDENPQRSAKLITTLLNRQVDGLLIVPTEGMEAQLAELQRQQVPFVLIDRYFPELPTSYVALDNYQALYQAVEHLKEAGYNRIGLVTLESALMPMRERSRGYLAALSAYDLPMRRSWLKTVRRASLDADVAKAVQALTTGRYPVDALIFTTNTLTLAGLRAIKARSIMVPAELGVVGFDETDAYDLFYAPPTYIRQPIAAMGQLATRLLLDALNAGRPVAQINLQASLVIQASTPGRRPLADQNTTPAAGTVKA